MPSVQTMISPLLALALALAVSASPLVSRHQTTIQWGPCQTQDNQSVPVSCATLDVPLDYTAKSSETLTLKLAKLSASIQPSKGSVLYNPGGPGDGGRNNLVQLKDQIQATVGGQHDIISWDPRGTGDTLTFSCFSDTANETAYNLLNSKATKASNVELERAWAVKTTYSQSCAENANKVGELISTAFSARDMMQIVDALNEDGLLRYYGQSYGTALGVTVAAMFPDRMDRVVLDGVLNPTQYYEGKDVQLLASSDATFEGFLSQCIAAPDQCAAARFEQPDLSLQSQVYAALEELKIHPIVDGVYAGSLVDYGAAKSGIGLGLYGPGGQWTILATALDVILSRNVSALAGTALQTSSDSSGPFPADSPDAEFGIRCSDSALRVTSLEDIMPLVQEFYDMSRITGDWVVVPYPLTCAQWSLKAKERYSGRFENITTKHPILFVGNTFDPITSLAGAVNASASFPGSRLLVHNGYGHTSFGQPSSCTRSAITAYFLNGTLPMQDAQCQPDAGLFAGSS